MLKKNGFQPTLPARGATIRAYPHGTTCPISTHAPRTGSDERLRQHHPKSRDFNPRSPHGERPRDASLADAGRYFNPRSPHGERRPPLRRSCRCPNNFNPRSPHGERRICGCPLELIRRYFNPRSPHGERRAYSPIFASVVSFQPTLPARGATLAISPTMPMRFNFNPRSPHGERLFPLRCRSGRPDFNPRSPHGERLFPTMIL